MARKKTTITDENSEAQRIEDLAARKKAALESLAEVRSMERDLGLSSGHDEDEHDSGSGNGNGGGHDAPPPNALERMSLEAGAGEGGEAPEESEKEKLERIILELSENEGRFEIFKVVNGTDSKIGGYPISDWPDRLDMVAREHGGGEFRVKFKRANGLYAKQVTRHFDPKAYGQAGPMGPQGLGGEGQFLKFMELMEKKEESHRRELESMRVQQMDLLKTLATQNQGNPIIRTAQDLKVLQEMLGGKEQKSPLDSIKEILEVVSVLKGSPEVSEPETPVMMALREGLSVIKPLLEAGLTRLVAAPAQGALQPSAPPAPRRLPPNDAAQLTGPASPASPPIKEEPKVVDPLTKEYATQLLQAATSGSNPQAVAAFIIQQSSDEQLEGLEKMAGDHALLGRFLDAEPMLVPHQRWCAEFFQAMREQIEDLPVEEAGTGDPAPTAATAPAPAPAPAPESGPIPAPTPPATAPTGPTAGPTGPTAESPAVPGGEAK